ncbi:MAG TPA: MFS transporter, partial [Thermomicrobiales bacterium]|nr:MFS transporter [Thermomicrobiales bacterium]
MGSITKPAMLAPLRHRTFRLLFGGQLVSDLGDWLDFLALIALIVTRWDLGPSALAALSAAVAFPFAVIAPLSGVWADRLPRKPLMVAADLGRALVVFGLVFAPNLSTVLALVFVRGVFSTFFGPARQATIASVVPHDDLLAANSLSQLSFQLTKILGPVLGGLLVAAVGPRSEFMINAVTFLVSAAFIVQLPNSAPAAQTNEDTEEQAPGFWREFRAGLSYLIHRRSLVMAVASNSAAWFIIFTFDSLGVLALRELGIEALFGLTVGSIGLGTAAGAIAIGQWGKRIHPFVTMGAGQIGGGLVVALLGVAVTLHAPGSGAWVIVYMLIGLSAAAVFVPYGYVVQVETPPEVLGRVFATAGGIQNAVLVMAPPVGAVLAERWGIGFVFTAAGIALALLGLVVFF